MRRKTETRAKVTPANERSYEQNFCKILPLKQKKRNKLFVLNNAKLLLLFFGIERYFQSFQVLHGCLPFTQKIRQFRMECKWKDEFYNSNIYPG